MSRGPVQPATPVAAFVTLLAAYSEQGWWPVTVGRAMRPTYRPGFRGRLTERQRGEICVGAILTQNTSWTNVERALGRLRESGIRTLADISALSARRLATLIRPAGYFRQKARKLKIFADHAGRRGGLGRWLAGPLAPLREELLGLWGIGPETADSILLYAGRRATLVVDAYTQRLASRLGWWRRAAYAQAQARLAASLPRDADVYAEFHALIVAHAKRHCRATPICQGCLFQEGCVHARRAASRRA